MIPLRITEIKRRVASGIPVSHCIKCGWWIAKVQGKCDECKETLKELDWKKVEIDTILSDENKA